VPYDVLVTNRAALKDAVAKEVKRPDFGLRLIIIWKCIKASLLVAIAVAAFVFRDRDLHHAGVDLVEWLGIDPASPRVEHLLAKLTGLTPMRIGAGACVYSAVLFVEAWGLHRRRVWAEWLTVIVTSSLIPFEVYYIATDASLGKVLALIANIAIVMYLLRHRWLFVPGRIGRWWKARRTAAATPPPRAGT
jgi:uncharacterized membrane protein (DUF2068 family)